MTYGHSPDHVLVPLSTVVELTGVSESTIRRLRQADKFPRARKVSQRSVRWVLAEILDWIADRPDS